MSEMKKFKIFWDIGYGENEDECETQKEADEAAYTAMREDCESQFDYWSEEDTGEEEDDD